MIKAALLGLLGCAGLYLLHRIGLWMERRGWIFYKHTRATSGAASAALGSAMQELNAFAEPQARYAIEEQRSDRKLQDHFDGLPNIDSGRDSHSGSE